MSYEGKREKFINNQDKISEFRILVLSNMYPNFMGGSFVHSQIKYLIESGCEARVVVPIPYYPAYIKFNSGRDFYSSIPEKEIIDSIPVYYPRYIRFPGKWFHSFSCYTQYWGTKRIVKSLIEEFRPNIIHAHPSTPAGYAGLMLKKLYNLPLICSLRGSDINVYPHYGRFSMYLSKKLISEADQLVSVSNALKLVANSIAKPMTEIRVVYNGCDTENFTHSKADRFKVRDKLNILKEEKVIIFVGSIIKDKGILELITAFIKLSSRYPDLHLIIVGDGSERLVLENVISSNNLNGRVHMIGEQPHSQISKFLNASDIFVHPSYYEGLPNVVLEAMACSLPVVATNVGGIPECVDDGKSGILINKKDEKSLSEGIEYLLTEKEIAQKMGICGREIVENKFSWKKNVEGIINIYKDVIDEEN